MAVRRAQPEKEWTRDFSAEHELVEQQVIEILKSFEGGQQMDPVSIVGPYGSGKTQLLYHIFEMSWERGIPALYIGHARTILESFERSGTDDLVSWLDTTCKDQVKSIVSRKDKQVDWFPPYEKKKSKIAECARHLGDWDGERYVLLVDELEQAYKEFLARQLTSDLSPLRVVLDGLRQCLMFWCFGLLSAYEFVGGADLRRFKDLRLPPITKAKVHEWIRAELKPLSNFVWWFSYGRIGWILKLADEAPPGKMKAWLKWADADLADYSEGNLKLINPLWHSLDSKDGRKGLKAALFDEKGHPEWISAGENSISLDQACNCLMDVLRRRLELKPHESRILNRRVDTLLDSLAVGDSQLLPVQLFALDDDFMAFFDLLADHIMAFEPASGERDRLLESLRRVRDLKGALLGKLILAQEQKDSFTLRPSVLKQVFASPMVNPDLLSSRDTTSIAQDLRKPIRIARVQRGIEVVFLVSPNRPLFTEVQRELGRNIDGETGNLYRVFVLVTPPPEIAGGKLWSIEEKRVKPLESLFKIHVTAFDSIRMYSFVLKIHEFLCDRESYDNALETAIVEGALAGEERREIRRTIDELWKQLDFWLTRKSLELAEEYSTAFSVDEELLWEKESGLSWWTSGEFTDTIACFSYGLVLSEDLQGNEKWHKIASVLRLAHENSLIRKDPKAFPFKEFLGNLFLKDGRIGGRVKNHRKTLSLKENAHKWSNLKSMLRQLMEGYGEEAIEKVVWQMKKDDAEIPILGNCGVTDQYEASRSLLRALMLCITSEAFSTSVERDLAGVSKNLEGHLKRLNDIQQVIEDANKRLEPPLEVKGSVISSDSVVNLISNVGEAKKNLDFLLGDLKKKKGLAAVGRIFQVVLDRYSSLILHEIDGLSSPISDLNILNQYVDLKDTHCHLSKVIQSQPEEFFSLTGTTKEAVAEREEKLIREAFDLTHIVGGQSVDLKAENFHDVLNNVDNHCTASADDLNELADALEKHQGEYDEYSKSRENTRDRLRKLADKILEADG